MQLEDKIREIIEDECEDYFFGVADLSLAKRSLIEQEELLIDKYPKSISIGITIPPIIPNELLKRDKNSTANYNDYAKLIQRLNLITTRLSNLLQLEGYKALTIHVSDKSDDQRIFSDFSHELVANLAGLGWIGKNGSLITPEVGSSVLWGTVLTDAPLKVTGNPIKEHNDLNKLETTYSSMDE